MFAQVFTFLNICWLYWWLLPLIYLLRRLFRFCYYERQMRLHSDVASLPSPPLPFWRICSIGHNLPKMFTIEDSLETANKFNKWRDQYGDIFYLWDLSGRFVIPTSETAIRTIHITKSACFEKSRAARTLLAELVGTNGILLAEGAQHARIRRTVAPSMHQDAIISVGDCFLEQGNLLQERLSEFGENGGDVAYAVRQRTFAVIFETCFGKSVVSDKVLHRLESAYVQVFIEPPVQGLLRGLMQYYFEFLGTDLFSYRTDLKRYIWSTISELCEDLRARCRRGEVQNQTRLLMLMVDEETNEKVGKQVMLETILSFLTAGQLTTSMVVCWVFYLLAREQHWQDKLLEEMNTWTEEDGIEKLDKLPLLDRVVKETLRLYPPVLFTPRVVVKKVELDGCRIPIGTEIRIPVFAMHRNVDIWGPDANEFNPDRFLRDGELARTKMFWMPFAFGPRGCIGQRFAIIELKAFITQVLKRQEVYIKPLIDPAPSCNGFFATPRSMKLYFRSR